MDTLKKEVNSEIENDNRPPVVLSKFRPLGRPPKWATVEELEVLLNEYFSTNPQRDWTITGLAIAIGTCRQTLCNYEKDEKFGAIIREAKSLVENAYELSLRHRGQSGDIFALKNFGWIDRIDNTNLNANVEVDSQKVKDKVTDMFND